MTQMTSEEVALIFDDNKKNIALLRDVSFAIHSQASKLTSFNVDSVELKSEMQYMLAKLVTAVGILLATKYLDEDLLIEDAETIINQLKETYDKQ